MLFLMSVASLRGANPGVAAGRGGGKPPPDRLVSEAGRSESIDLVIPLKQGRFYSLHGVLRESNSKLKTTYDLKTLPDRRYELTDQTRRALRLAALLSGLANQPFKVRFSHDRVVLHLPNPESAVIRRRHRMLLNRWFHLGVQDWKGKGLKIPEGFQPTRRTVLLIHGLEANAAAMAGLARACRNWGVQVVTFSYPNDGPIAESGQRLRRDLQSLCARYPRLRLVIVAHSMGGLVARYSLEHPGKSPRCVTDLFTLGTPHRGSHMAGGQPWLELVSQTLPNLAKGDLFGSLRDGLGEAAADLTPGSHFLKTLNGKKRPVGIRYHTAAGRRGFVSPAEYRALIPRLHQLLVRRRIDPLTQAIALGFLKQAADELRTGTGDGAVALSSALLTGVTDKKTFDRNHLELISVPAKHPERDAVFQWIVRSLKWPRQKTK